MIGIRLGSTMYKEKGTNFYFKLCKKVNLKMYMNCCAAKCPAKLTLTPDFKRNIGAHNHAPQHNTYDRELKFANRCKQRAQVSTESYREIYESEKAKYVFFNFIFKLYNTKNYFS